MKYPPLPSLEIGISQWTHTISVISLDVPQFPEDPMRSIQIEESDHNMILKYKEIYDAVHDLN